MTCMLEAHALGYRYGSRSVVDDVTLRFRAGEYAAIVGPNGAGKSTLLSLLAGLRAPSSGAVRLGDRALKTWPARERARRIAWLDQRDEAAGESTVRDLVRLGRLPHHGLFGAFDRADDDAVDAALADSECAAFAERRLNELSGGERRRVLLARALAVRAPCLLLDEPTAHLDPPHQRRLARQLAQHAQAGVAVIAVLHDLTLALAADRVIVLRDGRVHADGAADDARLHRALIDAFDGALAIERVRIDGSARWVAVPRL